MLRFQAVSLAKRHNFYGQMDKYVKEFSRAVLELGNKQVTNNLQHLLQSEIAIPNQTAAEPLIGDYKEYPRELDPHVLM